MLPDKITLCGFMGAGKSAVGALLARNVDYPFIDLDSEIARREGVSVAEIFARHGEAHFRTLERQVGLEALGKHCCVIALGGGALLDPDFRSAVEEGSFLIYLEAAPATLFRRIGESGARPLLVQVNSYEDFLREFERRMTDRRPLYELAHLKIATDDLTVSQVVDAILAALEATPLARTIELTHARGSYPVQVGEGLLDRLGELCTDAALHPRAALITSEPLWDLYGDRAQAALHDYGFEVQRVLIPDGEAAKTLAQVRAIYEALARARHERLDPVIALGGGSVGDTAGFAAATYLRGVPLVQVPTTLLAQVDSAIGGKTGVNLRRGKNLVGSFWQPRLVVADTGLLSTLPERQIASGLAEIIKYGCIARPLLLEMVAEQLAQLLSAQPRVDPELVAECVAVKAEIVAEDEPDVDRRRILNFGHTFGHAVESALKYETLLHGEAVALGMLVALELSVEVAGLDPHTAQRLYGLLRQIFPGLEFPAVSAERLFELMRRDKKMVRGRSIWILLARLGEPCIQEVASLDAVARALAAAQERWAQI